MLLNLADQLEALNPLFYQNLGIPTRFHLINLKIGPETARLNHRFEPWSFQDLARFKILVVWVAWIRRRSGRFVGLLGSTLGKAMDYVVLDSSGTDDDVPPTYQTGGPRVLFSGNGRSLAGAHSQPRPRNKLDSDIHQIEQQAYAGVLRAFKMQSDDITWEKESLITELRRELKVSDEEHRVLLNKVNEEEAIDRIRKLRQGGSVVHNHVPFKRQKEIHYPHSLPVGHQSPFTPLNVVAGNKAYTMAPEDTRWSSANQALPNRGAWQAADGVMLSTGKKGGRFHMNEDYALPNGFGAMDFSHIGILDTGNIVKEVERILSHPDMHEIIKAKKLLRDHEQALLDAIARLDEPSDGENEDVIPFEGWLGTAAA